MKTAACLLIALLPALAAGHDLWIERDGALHTLAYGHERSAHAGARTLEYSPAAVRQAACFDAAGRQTHAERGTAYPATLSGDCAASWFLVSSGYWSKTPQGTRNLPKTEAGATIDSWLSVEGVKRIDRWDASLARPLTDELELTPQDNPLQLKPGDKLRLRAWLAGQPVAGVAVAYFGKPRGVTDATGRVNIRLQSPGLQMLQASLEQPLADGKADRIVRGSTLQFELP